MKRTPNIMTIVWRIDDFEAVASQLEHSASADHGSIYERNAFHSALDAMRSNYDPCKGVSYSTVEFYLDEMCKK